MPRFYFHIKYDNVVAIDDEGELFADLTAARAHAEQSAKEMIALGVASDRPPMSDTSIEITDELGIVLSTIIFQFLIDGR